jgi:hypothetical protein
MLLILLAILALILFGVGFVVHWLFIVAAIVALIWLISLFTGGFGRSGARSVGPKRLRNESGGPLRAARSCATVRGCRGPRSSCGFSPCSHSRSSI